MRTLALLMLTTAAWAAPPEVAPAAPSHAEFSAALDDMQELRVRLAALAREADDAEELARYQLLTQYQATQQALDRVAVEAAERWRQADERGDAFAAEQAWHRVLAARSQSEALLLRANAGEPLPDSAGVAEAEGVEDWLIDGIWFDGDDFIEAGLRDSLGAAGVDASDIPVTPP